MSIEQILQDFNKKVSKQIQLQEDGIGRFRVFTPFRFDDGDHLVIVLRENEFGKWELTDNGHTFMHLSYKLDERSLEEGTRNKIITRTLAEFGVNDTGGKLGIEIKNEKYGNTLYDFIQAIMRINDVNYLSRERVKSTFMDDFKTFIKKQVPAERMQFDWNHSSFDPGGSYVVDCHVNQRNHPLMIFALYNDTKTRDATISLHQFERWGLEFESVSIFENQEEINRKVLARYSDVSGKQYSNLTANRDRISRYLDNILQTA